MPGQGQVPLDEMESGKAHKEEQIKREKPSASRLSAGHLSLDFVNTMHPDDFLIHPADLIRWSQGIGLIAGERAEELLAETAAYPEESSTLFKQAMTLREASYHVILALIHQAPPEPSDLHTLQSLFIQARINECLVPAEHQLVWQWAATERGLAHLYWSLTCSVEDLLTETFMERVKECPPSEGGCGWLFVDRSKNRSRQWCSDGECGSRIRMRRLYARKRAIQES